MAKNLLSDERGNGDIRMQRKDICFEHFFYHPTLNSRCFQCNVMLGKKLVSVSMDIDFLGKLLSPFQETDLSLWRQ